MAPWTQSLPPHPCPSPPPPPPPASRCWTAELAGKNGKVKADLGAGWIHGLTNNPITALAKQAGVPLAKVASDYEDTVTFLPNGNEATAAQDNKCEGLQLCGRGRWGQLDAHFAGILPLPNPCPNLALPCSTFLSFLALQVGCPCRRV